MSSLAVAFADHLERIVRPGSFVTSGVCEALAPGLEVEGIGPIALPLLAMQAAQLAAAADPAPYGRGAETLVDPKVRRTWQIDADRVRIRGRGWAKTLAEIVSRAAEGLGVTDPIDAELYKLLVYDEGSFFLSHRDTEKAAGMFATLVVVLPSHYTGGELVVRHNGHEVRLALQPSDPSEVSFAAFYADCTHEVLPITSGCKLTLVYSLVRRGAGADIKPPLYDSERDQLSAFLRQWPDAATGREDGCDDDEYDEDAYDDDDDDDDDDDEDDDEDEDEDEDDDDRVPNKLVYPLEHAYTQAGLTFEALKGADAARARQLKAAADGANCEFFLALLSIEESGSATFSGDYRSYRRRRFDGDDCDGDEEDFEVEEVFDRTESLSNWRAPDDGDPALGPLPVSRSEVAPPDALDDMVPDEQSFQEASGNEGATFERSYRKAALVVWPRDRRLAVINQGGLGATLPRLTRIAEQWAASGEDQSAATWAEAHELAAHMIAGWRRGSCGVTSEPSNFTVMLEALTQLGDVERIEDMLAVTALPGVYAKIDNPAVVCALRLTPPDRTGPILAAMVSGNGPAELEGCGEMLIMASAKPGGISCDIGPAARALVSALPTVSPDLPDWRRRAAISPVAIANVITALDQIDPTLSGAAVDIVLAWPEVYGADPILVPSVVRLSVPNRPQTPAVQRLQAAASAHLQARIDLDLSPPADWKRPASVKCSCEHCRELSWFLADPIQPTWRFKAAQPLRTHVERTIRNSACDVDFETIRQGTPHILACTKNKASFNKRVHQRQLDLAAMATIAAAAPT